MKLRKYILKIIVGLFFSTMLVAQTKQEISVYTGGGLSSLNYKTNIGVHKSLPGGMFGIGYQYFLTSKLGVKTGLELSGSNAKLSINTLSANSRANDGASDFEYRSKVSDYEEKQSSIFVSIPLMLQYNKGILYGAIGGKIGIPISGKYNVTKSTYENSGYYAFENTEYTEQEFLGFGTFINQEEKGDIDLKMAYMLSVELGAKWNLTGNMYLYTGIYMDYGLNDINKEKETKAFIEYNTNDPENFIRNSAILSHYTQDEKTESITDMKIRPLNIGFKVSLAFGL
ncbi:hypothetical protein [Dysgonomonas reticulitermitis]